MVGLQYLFLEPNADDPLNKGPSLSFNLLVTHVDRAVLILTEAAEDLRKNRDHFTQNVKISLRGGNLKGVVYDRTLAK